MPAAAAVRRSLRRRLRDVSSDPTVRYGATPEPETPYQRAGQVWDERIGSARVQAKNWRLAFFGTLVAERRPCRRPGLAIGARHGHALGGAGRQARPGAGGRAAVADYRPTDPQIAWHLARFIEEVRSIPADPVVLRQNWLDAYDYVTDKGALALNDYARTNDPFAKVGKTQVAVEVSSVIRASDDSFRVAWTERRYVDDALAATERWSAILTIVVQTADRRRPAEEEPARRLRPRPQLVQGARLMRTLPLAYALLLVRVSLGACSTWKPPEISYDDTPQPGGAAARSAQAGADRGSSASPCRCPASSSRCRRRRPRRPKPPIRARASSRPMARRACSRRAPATSTPSRSIPSPTARSIRSMPRPARSPTSR